MVAVISLDIFVQSVTSSLKYHQSAVSSLSVAWPLIRSEATDLILSQKDSGIASNRKNFLPCLVSLMPKLTTVGVLLTPPFSRWNLSDASLGRCFRKQITSYYRCPKKHPKIYYISTFNILYITLCDFCIFKQLIHIKYPLQKTNQLLFF